MKSKLLHQWNSQLKHFSVWYLVGLAVFFSLLSIYALRQNNLTSIRLRNEVYRVDQANGDIESALKELRVHIHGHMMSGLSTDGGAYPPIQLKYHYERLVAAQKKAASSTTGPVYTAAQAECEKRFPAGLSGSGRIPCIEQYVAAHQPAAAAAIPDALYKFDFAAPVWSPDVAGISLVLAAVFWLLLFVRVVVTRWLAHRLD